MFRLVNIEGTIIYSQIFTLAQAMCQLSNLGALFAVIRRSVSPGTAVVRDYTEAVWMLREAVHLKECLVSELCDQFIPVELQSEIQMVSWNPEIRQLVCVFCNSFLADRGIIPLSPAHCVIAHDSGSR